MSSLKKAQKQFLKFDFGSKKTFIHQIYIFIVDASIVNDIFLIIPDLSIN